MARVTVIPDAEGKKEYKGDGRSNVTSLGGKGRILLERMVLCRAFPLQRGRRREIESAEAYRKQTDKTGKEQIRSQLEKKGGRGVVFKEREVNKSPLTDLGKKHLIGAK